MTVKFDNKKFRAELDAAVLKKVKKLQGVVEDMTPVDTGHLKASYDTKKAGPNNWQITNSAEYAEPVLKKVHMKEKLETIIEVLD